MEKNGVCRNNIFYVRTMEKFENMTPDILIISYLDDEGEEKEMLYDYKTENILLTKMKRK